MIAMTTELQRAPLDPRVLAEAAEMVRVLGHPVRLRIVELLETGERTVKEMQEALDAPQALVSQQLARMRGAGIVAGRRGGANVWYRIADSRVVRMLDCLRHCDLPGPDVIGGRSDA
jgi:DNA-binding transcriptional ArsR family regulator